MVFHLERSSVRGIKIINRGKYPCIIMLCALVSNYHYLSSETQRMIVINVAELYVSIDIIVFTQYFASELMLGKIIIQLWCSRDTLIKIFDTEDLIVITNDAHGQ